MIVLVLGAGGQLGSELMKAAWRAPLRPVGTLKQEIDLTDTATITAGLARYDPAIVVNATGYTAVDQAESESVAAFAVNAHGVRNLATLCRERGVPLVHFSTDYIFDGTNPDAYRETDEARPLGNYGRSKLEGETAIRLLQLHHIILRIGWVYSEHGSNFVKTIVRLGTEREQVKVVYDQIGTPTSAASIAETVTAIVARLLSVTPAERDGLWGTYNFAAAGATTRYGCAERILAQIRSQTGNCAELLAVTSSEYPGASRRPQNCRLNCELLDRVFAIAREPWEDGVDTVTRALLAAAATRLGSTDAS